MLGSVDLNQLVPRNAFIRPVRWLVSGLVWAGWCWFVVRGKHCLLSEQADNPPFKILSTM